MRIEPLNDIVLLTAVKAESKSEGGIAFPDTYKKENDKLVEVVDVGPDVKLIKKGMRVICNAYGANVAELGGVRYLLQKEEMILGIVKN